MGHQFTMSLGILLTIPLGILFTMGVGNQFTIYTSTCDGVRRAGWNPGQTGLKHRERVDSH